MLLDEFEFVELSLLAADGAVVMLTFDPSAYVIVVVDDPSALLVLVELAPAACNNCESGSCALLPSCPL